MRLAGLVCLAALASCSSATEESRARTYPPGFTYIDRSEVRTVMQGLAQNVIALDDILRKEQPDEQDRANIRAHLESMLVLASQLERGEGASNMPHFSIDASHLRRDVELALAGATREPPSYYLTGQIAGACLYCHDKAREDVRTSTR